MQPTLLILGGTTEATALGKLIDAQGLLSKGLHATMSFAGRVERPARHPVPRRIGGFGGVAGLVRYLRDHGVTHVVDATHPFASQMSFNAVEACAQAGVPLIALTRPAWQAEPGDSWTHVPDIAGAVAALDRPAQNVMLAVGRMHLEAFAPNPQHRYLLRLVDAPSTPPPFPHHAIEVSRGPFTHDGDLALMQSHEIQLVVSKNAGGTGAYAKISAARALGLPVVMIDRPSQPERAECADPQGVLDWMYQGAHPGA